MPTIGRGTMGSVVVLLNAGGTPVGTAFILEYIEQVGSSNFYLVTCQHCVHNLIQARFQDNSIIQIGPEDWRPAASGDDVVAFDITNLRQANPESFSAINAGEIVNPGQPHYGLGVDIYMLGLLTEQRDTGRNLIRARFGNLSANSDPAVLIEQGNGANRPCHLGDMRSRPGFSGSPVMAWVDIPVFGGVRAQVKFLGIHSGQGRDRITVFGAGDYREAEIASSITRIVPAWEIINHLANDADLQRIRGERMAPQAPANDGPLA